MLNAQKQPMPKTSKTGSRQVSTIQVYETKNLDQFKFMAGNRPVKLQHVKRLAKSIEKHGMLKNPIIVNGKNEVVDGQHRLLAAKEANSKIYYMIVQDYGLEEVHALNLNQKNWTAKDYIYGYAEMGIKPYQVLKDFIERHDDYPVSICTLFCQNNKGQHRASKGHSGGSNIADGTWYHGNMQFAEKIANNLRRLKPLYDGYSRSVFAHCMIDLFKNKEFDFDSFLDKVKLQPGRLVDCANVAQCKLLIEDIYNYRRREKVNLRF